MTPSELAHADAAIAGSRRESSYAVSEMKIPAEFLVAVKENRTYSSFWKL